MFKATTIIAVVKNGQCAMAGDGQVTLGGGMIVKHQARKVRKIYNGRVLAGFAGSVADALTLFEKYEEQLEKYHGNLTRAAVELAKEWRLDKVLRRLEALLVVCNDEGLLIISGNGEIIEPDDGIAAIGSGSAFALSAARALCRHTSFPASEVAQEAMKIAGEMCVYTNENVIMEEI